MTLREEITSTSTLKEAMLSKDKVKVSVIRNLKSEISREEGGKKELSDTEIVNIIKKSIDNVTENKQDGWEEEVSTLQEFLPKQMSEEEIEKIILMLVSDGASHIGEIMKHFSQNYAGEVDNSVVAKIAKQNL